ncbi:RDD family protein, partial [Cellulomonas sp. 179-A 9B4 NHS]|uniref:RDD family protein n=1 Tax=Cellulomonas sp. 179-A 9B4 NHS TaxID=3142379 RepID=UPI00399F08FB
MTHRALVAPSRDGDVTDVPASLGRRFLAVAVDQVLVGLLLAPFTLDVLRRALATARAGDAADVVVAPVGVGAVVALVLATLLGLAQWVLHGRLGWTLGRRLLGVRTVDVHSRRPVGLLRVLLRELVVAAGALACLVGQVAVLVSPALDRTGRNRGWHDRAVDAEVLLAGARRPRPGAAGGGTPMAVSGPLASGGTDAPAPDAPSADAGGPLPT